MKEQPTPLQPLLVETLLKLGFKLKYFTTYSHKDYSDVNVSKFTDLAQFINYIHEDGKDQKRFEIQRALGI